MKTAFLHVKQKSILIIIAISFLAVFANAQTAPAIKAKEISVERKYPSEISILHVVQNFSQKKNLFGRRINKIQNSQLVVAEDPENAPENFAQENLSPCLRPPKTGSNFIGNPLTPFFLPPVGYYASESSIAISNEGKIVSISDGWIRYYDEKGRSFFSDSLYHFCSGLINCRVQYDSKKDRFVFVSLYGITDFSSVFSTEGVVAAFSKSNNPLDGWNFYYFSDDAVGDGLIADYPQLAISNDEIFFTNVRLDQDGNIIHSDIVQVDKNAAYSGAHSLHSKIYPVALSGSYTASIVPAIGGSTTYGPNMYFVMGDESGTANDLYYVFEITNTIFSGHASLKTFGPIHSGEMYSPAPLSMQPHNIPLVDAYAGFDDFMQNAFYENGILQFSQNSAVNGKAAVCIGRITGLTNKLSCKTQSISSQNLSLSFAQIAYVGNSFFDNGAIVGIEYTGKHDYPGLASAFVDNNFSVSPLTQVKKGEDTINALWGNYSALCRRYNHPGECWMEGQYGSKVFKNINWISELQTVSCNRYGENKLDNEFISAVSIAPNPFYQATNISFSIPQSVKVCVQVFDISGMLIKIIVNAQMPAGSHQFCGMQKMKKDIK